MRRIDERTDDGGMYQIIYDSFEEAVAFAEDRDREDTDTNDATDMPGFRDASIEGSERFTGTESLEETFDLARYGWQDGTDKVSRAIAEIEEEKENPGPGQAFANDVEGGMLDMGKYVSGEPDCFIKKQEIDGKERIITLAISISASSGISKDVLINRGAAICSAIDALESTGVSVEAYAVTDSNKYGKEWSHSVPIKQPDERLDMGRVVFTLAHPSYLRRFMFALSENHGSELRDFFEVNKGYGTPTTEKEAMVSPDVLDADVVMPGLSTSTYGDEYDTPEKAIDTMKEELSKQGIDVEF